MDKQQTAQQVADSLFKAEASLDTALADLAEAIAVTTRARAELGLGLKIGAGAVSKMTEVASQLAGGRETVAAAHDDLAAVDRLLHLRTVMTGGGDKGPVQPEASIRRVA
jgi:phage-related tail protein